MPYAARHADYDATMPLLLLIRYFCADSCLRYALILIYAARLLLIWLPYTIYAAMLLTHTPARRMPLFARVCYALCARG